MTKMTHAHRIIVGFVFLMIAVIAITIVATIPKVIFILVCVTAVSYVIGFIFDKTFDYIEGRDK